MQDSIFEHEINIFSIKEIYLMGECKSSYHFIPLGFFIIRITRHYFLLLSVNLLSVKPVSLQKKFGDIGFRWESWGQSLRGQSPLSSANNIKI